MSEAVRRSPSHEPEYRRQYHASRKEHVNAKRRTAYKNSAEARAKAAVNASDYRARNRDALRVKDAERRLNSLVIYAKVQIGECLKCGYDRFEGALQWHHVDPATKTAEPSWLLRKSDAVAFEELSKCVLLCANCHWEVGSGLWQPSRAMQNRCVRLLRAIVASRRVTAKRTS